MDYNTDYYYQTPTTTAADPAVTAAIVASVLVFSLIFFVIAYAIGAFLLGRVFKKAGTPEWIAWVPIYNSWKLLELGGQQGFWAVLALIPFVNFVSLIFIYIAMYNIGKTLGKEDWFVLLAIFVPIVWMIWLGFDDSKWPAAKKQFVTTTTTTKAASAKPVNKSKKAVSKK